jgi:HAD superfamily hydrolase (TIGR01549 family)
MSGMERGTMPIKGVLFDLGDTLIEASPSASETFQMIVASEKVYVSADQVKQAFLTAEEELGDKFMQQVGKMPITEFFGIWNFHVLKALNITDRTLARKIYQQWYNTIEIALFPDVVPILTDLKNKRIKTGIITSAYEEEIQKICEIVSLDRSLFDVVVGSDTIKRAKPEPDIFMYTLNILGITPEEAIYVGDNLKKDYRASENIGMNPILIVRHDNDVPENVEYITGLASLLGYLE